MGNLHRAHAFTSVILIVSTLGLAGCFGNEEAPGSAMDELPDPASLQAPVWEVGDEWHYVSEQGRWRNETVVAIEDYNGHQVYRVEVVYSTQDEFGVSKSIFLLDVESLGIFSHYDEDGAGVKIHPPANQLFPMINRTYEINIQYSWGQEDRHEITSKIDGWKDFEAPWGIVPSVKITIKIEKLEQTALDGQYNPDIGNYVQRTAGHHDEYYTLMSWFKANSHY